VYAARVPERVRLDKWLWAARFYKTRSQASVAIKDGKVDLGGARAKPSHQVGVGARIQVRKGPYAVDVEVIALSERRRDAEHARSLYAEDPTSVARREDTRARIAADRVESSFWDSQGRPTKKQRRQLIAFKERHAADSEFWLDEVDDD
jgi:ribosome-associated heat shock protein Hsp15